MKRFSQILFTFCMVGLIGFSTNSVCGDVIRVWSIADGANDGSSWRDAYNDLQTAIANAQANDEVWVAMGTYYPCDRIGGGTERHKAFQLKNGVSIYGGFSGRESLRDQRDWQMCPVVLSGDIGIEGERDDNCYHVFFHPVGLGLDKSAVLDGFVISGGNADLDDDYQFYRGGGMYNEQSSPTVENCTFRENYAGNRGGAVENRDNNARYINCRFMENSSDSVGGAVGNKDSTGLFANCIFIDNVSAIYGGGMYNYESDPSIINCTFFSNDAVDGGGVTNRYRSYPRLTNCITWGNSNDFHNMISSVPIVQNCIIAGCGGSGNWDSDYGTDHGGNLDVDPLFVDEGSGDIHLLNFSPAINAGTLDLSYCPAVDMDGEDRVLYDLIDIGADEIDGDVHLSISVTVEPEESVCEQMTITPLKKSYAYGEKVTIEVEAIENYELDSFAGDLDSTDNPVSFIVTKHMDITALFAYQGIDLYVDDDYGNVPPGSGTPTDPYCSIDTAINAALAMDQIHIAPGTYSQFYIGSSEDYLTLIGASAEEVIIDPSSHITIRGSHCRLEGMTIKNGIAEDGGGLYLEGAYGTQLSHCILKNNKAIEKPILFGSGTVGGYGGGIYLESSSLTVDNCLFVNNRCCRNNAGFLSPPNYISGGNGGTIYGVNSTISIRNSTFMDNQAEYVGGLMFSYCTVNIYNSILWGNEGHEIWSQYSGIHVYASDVDGGEDGVHNVTLGDGVIDADPEVDNYRLQVHSPCIDAGEDWPEATVDLDDQDRVQDGDNDGTAVIDMGAYEFEFIDPVEIYVDDDWSGLVFGDPVDGHIFGYDAFSTIRDALENVNAGDTVYVASGFYSGPLYMVSGVHLIGEDPATTLIDGRMRHKAIILENCDGTTTIEGFTIQNSISYTNGSGLVVTNSSGRMDRCIIINCQTTTNGGGFYAYDSTFTISNSVIVACSCNGAGSAVYIEGNKSDIHFANCTLVDNTSTASTVLCDGGILEIANSILYYNTETHPIDIINGGDVSVIYSCIEDGFEGEGNIHEEPKFADRVNRNYQLLEKSPCIDRGHNDLIPESVECDLYGGIRITDGDLNGTPQVDMGAMEYQLPLDVWVDDDWVVYSDGMHIPKTNLTKGINGFDTIRQAMLNVSNHGTIHLNSGIYYETVMLKDAVRLVGESAERCVIDGAGGDRCVTADHVGSDTVLENVTLQNGRNSFGGGGYMMNSNCQIINCIFTGHMADRGGVIEMIHSEPTFINCLFYGNEAGDYSGIYCDQSLPVLINCTFYDNHAMSNPDGEHVASVNNSCFDITNCILWDSDLPIYTDQSSKYGQVNYSVVQNGWHGTGNFDIDPMLTATVTGGYELACGSVCIDGGLDTVTLPATDLLGNARVVDGVQDGMAVVDIGCLEKQDYLWPDVIHVDDSWAEGYNGQVVKPDVYLGYNAFSSVQTAIDRVATPGVIYVHEGDYLENITLKNNISIIGDSAETTIIVGHDNGPTVRGSNVNSQTMIQSLGITGGSGHNYSWGFVYGGGLYLSDYADLTIIDCNIYGNRAGYGGAMYCSHSSPKVINCRIHHNTAYDNAAGIEANGSGSHVHIIQSAIYQNGDGNESDYGAFHSWNGGYLTLVNSVVYNNEARYVGGVCGSVSIRNSILWLNSHFDYDWEGTNPDFYHCLVGQPRYWSGDFDTIIDADPLFFDAGTGDFRLMVDSPCIDMGDNSFIGEEYETDFYGDQRILFGHCDLAEATIDMGISEFNWASVGSFDGDCDVDMDDFAILAAAWDSQLAEPGWNSLCNLSPGMNDVIDLDDLMEFVENWLLSDAGL